MDDEYWAGFPAALATGDVARILRISPRTTFRRLEDGRIPGYKVGSSWLVFRDELRAMLEAASNRSTEPTANIDVLDGYPEELGYRELMDVLGKTKATIYAWLDAGTLPAYRVDNRWIIYRSELRRALDEARNIPRLGA